MKIETELQKMDYLYFFYSNLVIQQPVENEILPSENEELAVTQHPGFFNKKRRKFTYETNRKSTAYIPFLREKIYVAGGLNGGTAANFLKMAKTLLLILVFRMELLRNDTKSRILTAIFWVKK